ncbi:MAG TPA: protein translocase subunit SecD [Mycobacteriales bacterium]|nr:protein translocase subunit SecD [Mycobacteriales bacterium]
MRGRGLRAAIAFGTVGAAAALLFSTEPRLGLDLRGGTQIVLETRDSATTKADAAATDRTLEVLRHRVDALGVSEPTLVRSGERRIIVELPDVQDPREAEKVIGRTAQLTFHPVLGVGSAPPPPAAPTPSAPPDKDGALTLPDESGQPLRLGPAALTGNDVDGAEAVTDPQLGRWEVSIDFRGSGAAAWASLTGDAACAPPGDPQRRVAIVLDDEVISSPQVETTVGCETGIPGGSTLITGEFTQDEANELALLVRAGALPVPVVTVEQHTVGATLGDDAIEASARAALVGAALTILYLLFAYRLAGVVAAVSLVAYAAISYAALLAVGATLTLPGVAGFVLAVGMAVDANVLVFERAREEFTGSAAGRLRAAIANGFRGAWSAIVDSNVTTLLAAGLLFFFATGPVRGFGVTLSIGVLASMFTCLVLSRVLLELLASRPRMRTRPGPTGLAGESRTRRWLMAHRPFVLRRHRRWLAVSAVALVIASAGIATRGLNFGVEFTGGRLVEYTTSRPVSADAARSAVAGAGLPRAVVQQSDGNHILVRDSGLDDRTKPRIENALESLGGATTQVRDEFIGPSLGDELKRKALMALGLALAAQMLYLAIRFRWTLGLSAVLAMAHDVVLLLGLFAWLGKPIDGVFLAAVLTVIGYSVNDSVVVFDRLRELLPTRRRTSFAETANLACLQTLPRTINTGIGAMFILAALTLFGGSSLTDFALALLVGIAVGTYSSVFTATPLAIELDRHYPDTVPKAAPRRVSQRARATAP